MHYIYGLIDPFTHKVRYIGQSIRPYQRLTNHCNDKSKTHRTNWIQSLIRIGSRPRLIILQELPSGSDWKSAEIKWISISRKYNWPLTNCTDGGDGVTNLCGPGKERMLKTWKGRKHKPETIEKLRQANIGKKMPEHSDRMAVKMAHREITWKDKLQKANRKLDDNLLQNAIDDLKLGMKVIDAANKYGVHRTTMSKIKAGTYKTFKQKTYNYVKPRKYHTMNLN